MKNHCNADASFYICSDGKKHIIKNKTYNLSSFQESIPVSAFFTAISVEKEGTVVDASQINVTADNPNLISVYGAYVQDGGKLVLTDSNFKDVSGFRVLNADVHIKDGKITGVSDAIYAMGDKTDIALVRVNIEIEHGNVEIELGDVEKGIVSSFGAWVRMSGSTVTFNGIGAFSTYYRGRYLIDSTNINGKGKKYAIVVDDETIDQFPEAFQISQGGDVHLRDDSIQLVDMHGFFIQNSSGYAYESGKLITEFDLLDAFKKTDIAIERSNITVQGKETYGFYFYGLDPNSWDNMLYLDDDKRSKIRQIVSGVASVSLSKTIVSAPDSIAIYSTGSDGYGAEATIELSDQTKISGDLLLKAESNSSILVKADDSSLTGGIRVEDISTVNLQLLICS